MKRMLSRVTWAATGVSIAGFILAGSAAAGTSRGHETPTPGVHVINLHNAYEARLGHAKLGPISGIVYGRGKQPKSPGSAIGCTEPNCPVVYDGGPVQHNPHVYLLLWGPDWSTDSGEEATASYLESFFQGLGVQPADNWSTIMTQYSDSTGHPTFGVSVFQGSWQDTTTPPFGVGQSQLAAEADAFASQQGITDLSDAQIVIATQSGTCPAGFLGSSCGRNGNYCAWHAKSNEPYINLPYLLDAGSVCGEDFVNAGGTEDGFSLVAGHEYAETITDPAPDTGWWDPNDASGGEIADKCEWSSQSNNVTLSTGSFAVQPLWSNSANSCAMPPGEVSVANPGNQITYQESSLSLQVRGTSAGNYPLTWSATGLPGGLTINPSSGLITGQITAAPATYNVTVTVSDTTGAFARASFNWTVKADVGTPITNVSASTCLNDHSYSIASGNPVVMWACNTKANEQFTHPTNQGELVVLGHCLTDPGHGGAGTKQILNPCTGASSQEWYYNSQHEYVLQKNLLCLTDPQGSKANGTSVEITKCTGAKAQQWLGS